MIARVWRGWTTPGNADEYQRRLTESILPAIADELGEDYAGYEVHRRAVRGEMDRDDGAGTARDDGSEEVAFVTTIYVTSVEAVRAVAGDDLERAHVPPEAREVLSRWEETVDHREVVASESPEN